MNEDTAGSVSVWIVGLKGKDSDAIRSLWGRYYKKLVKFARQRLGRTPRRVADEEDIALSVFDTVCRGAAAGRFDEVADRDDLWWLLLAVTQQKVVDHVRWNSREKRGGGRVVCESELPSPTGSSKPFSLSRIIGESPTPEFLVALDDEYRRLLSLLRDDQLRQVADWRIEGLGAEEIAARLDISVRSVERKLKLIQNTWSGKFDAGSG